MDFHTKCEKSTYCDRAVFPIGTSISVLTRVSHNVEFRAVEQPTKEALIHQLQYSTDGVRRDLLSVCVSKMFNITAAYELVLFDLNV